MPTPRTSTASKSSRNSNASGAKDDTNWVQHIQNLVYTEQTYESPIDINLTYMTTIYLPKLTWHHVDLIPKKMKVTNTGHTLILSGKWNQERPYLTDGPFMGNYVFSQLHFHWGYNNMEGSEHTIDGSHMPLEMHVVLFKSCYLTQESALKKKDGIAVLAYFFKLQGYDNPAIQMLVDAIPYVQKPHSSARLDPIPLEVLVKPFMGDYFLYWGSVTTTSCVHSILWLLSREPVGVSAEQIDMFRSLMDINEEPLVRNFRQVQNLQNRGVFHVCPSTFLYSTLLAFPKNHVKPSNRKNSISNPANSTSFQSQKDVCAMQEYTESPFKECDTNNCSWCTCSSHIPRHQDRVKNRRRSSSRSYDSQYIFSTINEEVTPRNRPTVTCRARGGCKSPHRDNYRPRSNSRHYCNY